MADTGHGAARPDEHRGVRAILFRRVHARLCEDATGSAAAGRSNEAYRPGPHRRAGRDGSVVLHQGGRRRAVLRDAQRARRRVFYLARSRQHQRRHSLQHADDLQRRDVREHSPGVSRRSGRRGDRGREPGETRFDSRHRRRCPFRRRVRARLQSPYQRGDEGHPLRREDCRITAPDAGPGVCRGGQRQPLRHPLGSRAHPAPGVRRRPDLL